MFVPIGYHNKRCPPPLPILLWEHKNQFFLLVRFLEPLGYGASAGFIFLNPAGLQQSLLCWIVLCEITGLSIILIDKYLEIFKSLPLKEVSLQGKELNSAAVHVLIKLAPSFEEIGYTRCLTCETLIKTFMRSYK